MTEAADASDALERRSLLTDRTTIAALLVVMSAAVFVIIAFANRHDHSTHDHPSADVVSDVSASDPEHDHSTHDHSEDIGSTFVSTERISPPAACRTIVGCDDAGPKPQNPGDRGGWAQLLTLGAVAVGLAFIATRIIRATRGATTPPQPSAVTSTRTTSNLLESTQHRDMSARNCPPSGVEKKSG